MKQFLRIALISEHASPLAVAGGVDAGGQNVYVDQVARCLAEAGHQVDVLTRRDARGLPAVSKPHPGVRVLHVRAGPARFVPKEALLAHMPQFRQECERLLQQGPLPDIVHANFFMSGLVAHQLRQALDIPYVVTFHALGLVRRMHQAQADAFPDERIDIERMLACEADAVIAECPQDEDDLALLYGAPASRVRRVPCGFDAQEFGPMDRRLARTRLGLDPDEFVILQLGRMVPRKGVDNVIRALSWLPRGMRARLLVVGGDSPEPDERLTPEIARLRQVARECGVADQVTFVGHRRRHQLRPYYAAANVFATTPWYEPFGITPLEAMACAIPVVASAVGGLKHTVMDGATGCLVPAHEPQALAHALAYLHDHPQVAAAMGRAGLHRARSLFTWERLSELLQGVYQEVITARQDAAGLPIPVPAWPQAQPASVMAL